MRPTIPDDLAERLEDVVDDETRVPAEQLTVKQQLEVLVETAEEGRVNNTTRL